MNLKQIHDLLETLQTKIAEGLEKLKTIAIDSPEYATTLNNVITSTTLVTRFKIELQKLSEEKGDA